MQRCGPWGRTVGSREGRAERTEPSLEAGVPAEAAHSTPTFAVQLVMSLLQCFIDFTRAALLASGEKRLGRTGLRSRVILLCIHCFRSTDPVPVTMRAVVRTKKAVDAPCSGQSRPLEEQWIPLGVEGHGIDKLKRIQRESRMGNVWATPLTHIFLNLRPKDKGNSGYGRCPILL